MAKPHERALAFILAVVFLATSVIGGIGIIWQINQDKKQGSADNQESNNQQAQTPQEGQLQGTKLTEFTPVAAVDSLQVIDLKVGDGAEVKPDSSVVAHYTGATAKDGTIFESSLDSGQPATFPLSGVIAGWQQGVPGMKVGGKRRLIIPAALAYGEAGSPPTIGPNEPLVFDIEMIAIE